jgi:hypothetical protein
VTTHLSYAERLDLARGAFIAAAIEIEASMDAVLAIFFEVTGATHYHFVEMVLNEMSAISKQQAVKRIADTVGYDGGQRLVGSLDALRVNRNKLAHRPMQMVSEMHEGAFRVTGPHLVPKRTKAEGEGWEPIDIDEVLARAQDARHLLIPLAGLMNRIEDWLAEHPTK